MDLLVQHSLVAMLDLYHDGLISLEKIVEKMCHNPAKLFRIKKRGFIKEGYYADLTILDLNKSWTVSKENILYKCGWSPFDGHTFKSSVQSCFLLTVIWCTIQGSLMKVSEDYP